MKRALFLAAITAALSHAAAFAEDVRESSAPLWSGSAEASLLATSGNTDTESLGLGLETRYAPQPWSVLAKGKHVRSSSQGLIQARPSSASARAARALNSRMDVFTQLAFEQDEFAGMRARWVADAGLGWEAVSLETHSLKLELGAGYGYEERTQGALLRFGALTERLDYKWKLSPTADFRQEVAATESLANGADWRLEATPSLTARVTELLSLKASYRVAYRNEPVEGRKRTDTTTSFALVAKF
jgi:putative salt-induced outer membrane protein